MGENIKAMVRELESQADSPLVADCLVSEKKAALLLGVAVQTLRNWRFLRRGVAYHKIGRRVLYTISDIENYKLKHRIDPEAA